MYFSIVLSLPIKKNGSVTEGRASMVKCRETPFEGDGFKKIF